MYIFWHIIDIAVALVVLLLCLQHLYCIVLQLMGYIIGSQSAPYGAPRLRERNLGAPQAIRLLSIFFYKIYCGAP